MSILAILVALTSVLGHRTHTEAVLVQTRSSDEWNLYQAKKIRQTDTALAYRSALGALVAGRGRREKAGRGIQGSPGKMERRSGGGAEESDRTGV